MDNSRESKDGLILPRPKYRKPFNRNKKFWVALLVLLIIAILIRTAAIYLFKTPSQTTVKVPVTTGIANKRDVPVYLYELGNVTPVYTITVKTQINGQLLHVYFKEGQMVAKGDLLAQIDPRPYEAQLLQYQGQLMRDQAALANDTVNLKRYQKLWKQDAVSKQTLDNQATLVQQDLGTVKADLGLIEGIKVNLIYCRIISPVNGRIGLRLVDPGNFVQTSDTTGLAVIATLQPITVIFTIPEDNIPDVLQKITSGNSLEVKAYDRQQNQLLAIGKVLTIDNQIDTTTGMVKIRALFDNNENKLFPSQFVNVELLVKTLNRATVVPTAAIQFGPNDTFVYVVNKNNTVTAKSVKTSVTSGNDTVILSGIAPGEAVVIQGVDKLKNGASVTIANAKSIRSKTQSNGLNNI